MTKDLFVEGLFVRGRLALFFAAIKCVTAITTGTAPRTYTPISEEKKKKTVINCVTLTITGTAPYTCTILGYTFKTKKKKK
jgi:hypothetical protein